MSKGSSCELSSLDSVKNTSTDNSQVVPKLKGSIIEYKYRTKVIAQVVYFVSFILISVAIVCPWISIRSDAIKCFNKLFDIGMPNITDYLSRLIGGQLDKYQMITIYLASLYKPPSLITVDDNSVFELIKFSKSTYDFCAIKPVFIFTSKPGEIFYQVCFSNNDFNLYVRYIEGNQTINKKYPSKYDFQAFNHSIGGSIVDSIPGFQNTLQYEEKKWANIIMELDDGSIDVFTYSLAGDGVSLKVGIGYEIHYLMDTFKSGIPNSYFRYAFMAIDGGVLFDSINGLQSPHYDKFKDIHHFPRLNELGVPFWTALSQINYSKFQNEFVFEEMYYLTRYAYVQSLEEVTYAFLLVIEKDQLLSIPLYKSAVFFIVLIVLIAAISLFAKFLQKRNMERCKAKLSLRDGSLFPENDEIESYSTLQHCITQIRKLELMFPEENSLNHTLDKVVINLTESHPSLNPNKKNVDSLLFSALNTPPKGSNFANENCFHYWRSMIKNILQSKAARESSYNLNLNSNLNSNSIFNDNLVDIPNPKVSEKSIAFDANECISNPSQYLMKTFLKLIFDESLLFQIFDPDILLQFIFQFSTNLCFDCVSASFQLLQLHYIITKYFSTWFNNKFDLLIIYFTSIIYYTNVPETYYDDNQNEYEEEEENRSDTDNNENNNNNNNNNNSDSKSDNKSGSKSSSKNSNKSRSRSHPKNKSEKKSDDEVDGEIKYSNLMKMSKSYTKEMNLLLSKNSQKFDFIIEYFTKFFDGIQDNNSYIYFSSSVKQIFLLIQDFKMFQLLGEFRVRIESPEFSIFTDINDKYLFFSALIKFCQFGVYCQDMEMMQFLVQNINNVVFSHGERENRLLLAEYHFESSSKLATYWLNCFSQFVPMKKEKMNLMETINFWLTEKNTLFQEDL